MNVQNHKRYAENTRYLLYWHKGDYDWNTHYEFNWQIYSIKKCIDHR